MLRHHMSSIIYVQKSLEYGELMTNMLASQASANLIGTPMVLDKVVGETMEMTFNYACISMALGDYMKSRDLLMMARKCCESDEIYKDDVPIIDMQLVYIEQRLGNAEKAREILDRLISSKNLKDSIRRIILEMNLVCLKGVDDLFESQRRLKQAIDDINLNQFASYQKEAILFNHALLNFHMGKYSIAKEEVERGRLNSKLGNFRFKWLLLASALFLKEKKMEEAIEFIRNELKMDQDSSNSLVHLILPQLLILSGHDSKTLISTLQAIPHAEENSDIVRVFLVCCDIAKNPQVARSFLDPCFKAGKLDMPTARDYARFLYRCGFVPEAITIYDHITNASTSLSDKSLIAEAIQVCALLKPAMADRLSKLLPSEPVETISPLTKSEIDTLENLPTYKSFTLAKKPFHAIDTRMIDSQIKLKSKSKKKKKTKFPKNYDSNQTPNPERWLPKHLRSTTHLAKQEKTSSRKDVLKKSESSVQVPLNILGKSPPTKPVTNSTQTKPILPTKTRVSGSASSHHK